MNGSFDILLLFVFFVFQLLKGFLVDDLVFISVVNLFLFCFLFSDGCFDFDLFMLVVVELMEKEVDVEGL